MLDIDGMKKEIDNKGRLTYRFLRHNRQSDVWEEGVYGPDVWKMTKNYLQENLLKEHKNAMADSYTYY